MEMKRREARDLGDGVKVQRLIEVAHDVIDGAVDALEVMR